MMKRPPGSTASPPRAGPKRSVWPPSLPQPAKWPADATWPDWFMFGDPHTNYYEGEVFYDDVTLEVWRDAVSADPATEGADPQ